MVCVQTNMEYRKLTLLFFSLCSKSAQDGRSITRRCSPPSFHWFFLKLPPYTAGVTLNKWWDTKPSSEYLTGGTETIGIADTLEVAILLPEQLAALLAAVAVLINDSTVSVQVDS